MQRVWGVIVDPRTGKPVPNAQVTVYAFNDVVPLPSVYVADANADPTGTLDNPVVSDAYGRYAFSLPTGRYDFAFSGSGFGTYTIRGFEVSDVEVSGGGTVSSVGLSMPAIFTVGGTHPVVTTGTIAVTLATQTANKVWAGPASGAPAAPAFRDLVLDDMPAFGPTASTTFGTATKVAAVTTNADGIITAISEITVTPAWSSVTGKPTTISGYAITDGIRRFYQSRSSVNNINTVAEVDLFSAATYTGTIQVPSNTFTQGSQFIVKAFGFCNTTASPRIRARLRFNGATVMLDLYDTTGPMGTAGANWDMELTMTCITTGGSGTWMAGGFWRVHTTTISLLYQQSDATTGAVTLATDAANTPELLISCDATSAANGFTCTSLTTFIVGA
jgi:hypothetical protein